MTTFRKRIRGDEGTAVVELVGVVTMLLIVTMLCVQGLFISQVGAVAQQAARDGARAHAVGHDPETAAREQIPGWATVESISVTDAGDARRVAVTLRVPIVLPGITSQSFVVSRDAVLPRG